jgi:two-component system, OmpR family, sensor histidine kinase CpxA
MRIRLWTRIGITLAVNLALLLGLVAIFLIGQSRLGIEAIWFTPARERIRALGSQVEMEFPDKTDEQRTAMLAEMQKRYHVTLALYEDSGQLKAGPDLHAPEAVIRQIQRRAAPWPDLSSDGKTFAQPPRPEDRAMFMLKENDPSRYWVGVNTPILKTPGTRPTRHVLVVVTPSLLASTLFVDWSPWILGVSLALLVTILCWAPLVRRLTKSIEAMRVAAGQIAAGRFNVDVPADGRDELGELGQSIGRMSAQLQQLVNGQTRFLADVAHELCAPLSRIQLSTAMLEENSTGDNVERVRRLERDVQYMAALVGDLLSFTKGAARQPDLAPVPLAELVNTVIEQENAPPTGLTAAVDSSLKVVADREYLQRAVSNVLRNAIRYAAHAGPIRILAERSSSLDSGSQVRLTIQDSGPGLPEKELEAIFAPFYRPDTSRTPGLGGVGLGLAIVKGCIEICGGKVVCKNLQPFGLAVEIYLREAEPA